MNIITTIFSTIVNDLGSALVLPIIFFVIGIVVGMKPGKAISSGLTLGIAITGVGLVTGYLTGAVGGAAADFAEATGSNLNAIDVGWAAALGIAWQWRYAFLMFPLHIIVNVIMLALGKTVTLNVDMWNVANKVATGFFVFCVCNNVFIGFAVVAVQSVLELLIADANRKQVQKITGVPGVSIPHPMFLNAPLLWPIQKVLDKVIPPSWKIDADSLQQKIGILGESSVMGFIVGTAIGLIGKRGVVDSLTIGIQVATALILIPMASKLFMAALAPISEAANKWVTKRFPGKEMYIGLDWPIVAGCNEIYLVAILSVPVVVALAIVLPFNTVLPLAGVLYLCVSITVVVMYERDFLKCLITNIITIPFTLFAATYFSPMLDGLAREVGTDLSGLSAGQQMAWYGIDIGFIRWFTCEATTGNLIAIGFVVLYAVLTFFYLRDRKQVEAEIAKTLEQ